MADVRLSLADQALANAIFVLAGKPVSWGSVDDDAMFVSVVRDLLPHANRDHPKAAVLIEAGEEIVAAYRSKSKGYQNDAYQVARVACRQFAEWRLAEAWERLKHEGKVK
jgi:uncharacterized protein (DUF4415 family)